MSNRAPDQPHSSDLEQDSQVGQIELGTPNIPASGVGDIPIIAVKRIHDQPLTPNGFYGVLTPYDKIEREGYIIAQYKEKI